MLVEANVRLSGVFFTATDRVALVKGPFSTMVCPTSVLRSLFTGKLDNGSILCIANWLTYIGNRCVWILISHASFQHGV